MYPASRRGPAMSCGAGQLAEQTAIVAAENPQPLGNRKDELAMGRRGTDDLGDRLAG